jgi:hypothetical protein
MIGIAVLCDRCHHEFRIFDVPTRLAAWEAAEANGWTKRENQHYGPRCAGIIRSTGRVKSVKKK